jgi:hypothetical protein
MRLVQLAILLAISFFLNGQESLNLTRIFKIGDQSEFRNSEFVDNSLILKINEDLFRAVLKLRSEQIDFSVPINEDEIISLQLQKFEVFTDDFILRTSSGDTITKFDRPIFYHGKLPANKGMVTISFSESELIGIISINGKGDYNLGKLEDSENSYIIYNDNDVKIDMGVECHVKDEITEDEREHRVMKTGLRVNCVKFYLEGDYALYLNKGTISNTASYIAGLFAQMAGLYANENINIEIKEIKIWTTPDGYNTNDSSIALDQFMDNNPIVSADLAHLFALGGNNTGGLAWVDVLCDVGYNFAYSNISANYNNIPTFSWSVEVITHETGHNLGSRHTHACVWNGNNTQIDDCGNKYFYDNGVPLTQIEGYPCYNPSSPILPTSGTIMSYCHLLSGIGINFTNGFGTQPGDLIRSKVNSATCLSNCGNSPTCPIPVNVSTESIIGTTANLEWEAGTGGNLWQIEYGISGFSQGSGNTINNISSTSYQLNGLEGGTTYDWYIRTDCGSGVYSSWVGKKTFTTYCPSSSQIQLPYLQDWESNHGIRLTDGTIMCDFYENWQFDTDKPDQGRVFWGTQCPTGFIITGAGSLLMDKKNNYGDNAINYSILNLDLSDYTNSQNLFFKFLFMDISDENSPNDKVWVRGNEYENWIVAYDILPASKENYISYVVKIDLDSLLSMNSQTPGNTFQIRFGQEENGPYGYGGDGLVYDNIEIYDCGENEIPYNADFSDTECWKVINNNNDSYIWSKKTGSSCDDSYYGLEYTGAINPSVSMDDWLFSPGFYLSAGSTYRISFNVGDAGMTEKMEVFLATNNNVNAALEGNLLFKDESLNNGTCELSTIDFTAPSTGYFFIAFHGYSNSNSQHFLYLDDFNIDNAPTTPSYIVESNTNNNCDLYFVNGVAGYSWHHILNSTGNYIASINPNGQTLGQVSVDMRDGGNVETYSIGGNNAKTIPRYFNFNSENSFSNPVSVRIYFLNAELIEFNQFPPISNYEIGNLQINHYDGINEDCNFGNNSNTGNLILSSAIANGTTASGNHYLQLDVNQFSEFLIHQPVNSSLALTLQFNGFAKENINQLDLELYDVNDFSEIILMKKSKESEWEKLTSFNNSEKKVKYQLFDENPFKLTFYKLIIVQNDGSKTESKTIVVDREKGISHWYIYPNPADNEIYLSFENEIYSPISIDIINSLGKSVYSEDIDLKVSQKIKLNSSEFPKEIYFLNIRHKDFFDTKKLIINR